MIDMAAYRKMHPPKSTYNQPTKLRDDLGPAKMSRDEPPDGDFCLLLPSTIDGFNMNEKKWSMITGRVCMENFVLIQPRDTPSR
jgi:hypothetical protein